MTDSKTPDWVKAEAHEALSDAVRDERCGASIISQALLSAYERGRKEGIEEAAKVVSGAKIYTYVSTGEFPAVRPIEHRDLIATAIRQLLEVKG